MANTISDVWGGTEHFLKPTRSRPNHASGWQSSWDIITIVQNNGSKDVLSAEIIKVMADKSAYPHRGKIRIVISQEINDHFRNVEWKSGHRGGYQGSTA
jgi:hypothetical protein